MSTTTEANAPSHEPSALSGAALAHVQRKIGFREKYMTRGNLVSIITP